MNLPFLRRFARDERGQSLILVAGGFAMLLAAAAMSIDWGYSYFQRRAMTNASQAGALAGGRLLAGSAVVTGSTVFFSESEEQIYAEACSFVQKNVGNPVEPSTYTLVLQFLDTSGSQQASISETITKTVCNTPATTTTIPSVTRDLRVTATVSYPAMLAGVIGQHTLAAAASSRSRVAGASVTTAGTFNNGTPWAMVRHYDPTELVNTCGSPCNPTNATPYSFWGNESFGNYKGLIDFAKVSGIEPTTADQLITSWDKTGSLTSGATSTPKPDKTSPTGCTSALFDTAGTTNSSYEKACSIPNWMYYGFWGALSLVTDHTSVGSGQHAPTALGTRSSICSSPPTYLYTPSCGTGNDHKGDWVETFTNGNAGTNISGPLSQTITTYGETNQFSTQSCGSNCSSGHSTYGKALTVMVYLWDCAEQYSASTWTLIQNKQGTDCADMGGNGNCNGGVPVCWTHGNPTPARVHVFTYAPFTFYEGLIDSSGAKGFWGGGFGAPSSCPTSFCALNALSNTTFLVGDP